MQRTFFIIQADLASKCYIVIKMARTKTTHVENTSAAQKRLPIHKQVAQKSKKPKAAAAAVVVAPKPNKRKVAVLDYIYGTDALVARPEEEAKEEVEPSVPKPKPKKRKIAEPEVAAEAEESKSDEPAAQPQPKKKKRKVAVVEEEEVAADAAKPKKTRRWKNKTIVKRLMKRLAKQPTHLISFAGFQRATKHVIKSMEPKMSIKFDALMTWRRIFEREADQIGKWASIVAKSNGQVRVLSRHIEAACQIGGFDNATTPVTNALIRSLPGADAPTGAAAAAEA